MNRLLLSARLIERGARRYTPAGLPVSELLLQHESEQTEDGQPRRVNLELRALAIGAITQTVDALELGATGSFAGFLAHTRNGRGVLFHITSLDRT
ncbi:MAG: primosomal replication protein N [Burkholderiaceae bacterium]